MSRTPAELRLLEVFSAVAEEQSFSKAAKELGIAKGTVSRSIAQLEARLEVELLHRTTHHVALSTAGAALYERTKAPLTALRAAMTELPERDAAPSGLLRMTAPSDFGAIALPSVLSAFSRRFPAIQFDVRLSGRQVDLVKEGYDLAIRAAAGQLKDSTLTVRRLGKNRLEFYAAPSYLARRGRPKRLGDDRHTWVLHHAGARLLKVDPALVQFSVDDFLLARGLLRDGAGVGVLPSFIAQTYVREGWLEEVPLTGTPAMEGGFVMLYPSSGQTPKKLTAFRDFLVDAFRSGLG